MLEWLGHSLDLNLKGNLWALMNATLQKLDCTTMTKLIETIFQVRYRDPQIKKKLPKIDKIYAKTSDASVEKQKWPYPLLKVNFCEV